MLICPITHYYCRLLQLDPNNRLRFLKKLLTGKWLLNLDTILWCTFDLDKVPTYIDGSYLHFVRLPATHSNVRRSLFTSVDETDTEKSEAEKHHDNLRPVSSEPSPKRYAAINAKLLALLIPLHWLWRLNKAISFNHFYNGFRSKTLSADKAAEHHSTT